MAEEKLFNWLKIDNYSLICLYSEYYIYNIYYNYVPIYQIQGTCAGGFEDVRALFENNFRKGHEVNAQLCIYVDGNVVVDLYGTAVGDAEYGPDTLAVRFTSVKLTKS